MRLTLNDIPDIYSGKTGYLIGKGKSLALANEALSTRDDDGPVVGINEVPTIVPCDFNLWHDPVPKCKLIIGNQDTYYINKKCTAVLPPEFDAIEKDKEAIIYHKNSGLVISRDFYRTNNCLFMGHSTAHSGFNLLYMLNVKNIIAYGFDAVVDEAAEIAVNPLQDYTNIKNKDPNWKKHIELHYKRFKKMLMGMSLLTGIEIQFVDLV